MMRALGLALMLLATSAAAQTVVSGALGAERVIDRLDVADLPAGAVQRFWFRAGDTSTAQRWLVPVVVVKGAKPGPRLLVTAGIHGDELNGIDVLHKLVARLDVQAMAGTLIAVPGLNPPGLLQDSRQFAEDAARGADNLNRAMPGNLAGSPTDHHAALLWENLFRPNADLAVDLHTQSRGTAYVLYAFASTARTKRMAELLAPDVIKLDRGVAGTVENELTNDGVPAVTLELGRPGEFDGEMVTRGVDGLMNLMREQKMIVGAVREPPSTMVVGNALALLSAPRGGFATLLAPLGSRVEKGAPIATIADAFGRVTDTLLAPETGVIASAFTDPRRPRDAMIVRIIHRKDDSECEYGCP
jgi:hypothetical protein